MDVLSVVKFKVPDRVHTKKELFGAIDNLENVENIVVLINDDTGVWMMTVNGTTAERMNWMLDRAKLLLHKAD
jgi:hypothetical protein